MCQRSAPCAALIEQVPIQVRVLDLGTFWESLQSFPLCVTGGKDPDISHGAARCPSSSTGTRDVKLALDWTRRGGRVENKGQHHL